MSLSNQDLIAQLSTDSAPQKSLDTIVQDLESTEEGRAWLKATADLEKKYKHKATVMATNTESAMEEDAHPIRAMNHGAFKEAATASGNFYSVPIPFFQKAGLEVKSDNLRRKYNVENDLFWLAAPGFQAGTIYYNDINDLSGKADCLVGPYGPYFSATFSNSSKSNYATFQAANVGLPNLPIPISFSGGNWTLW